MKRILSILLILVLLFTLCSCKQNEASSNKNSNSQTKCINCGAKITSTDRFCSECGQAQPSPNSKEDSLTSPSNSDNQNHTHKYNNETITKFPTCTEQGVKTYYCIYCSSTKAEAIASLGHDWQVATCVSSKKCSRCNIVEGEPLQHNYSGNNCTLCGKEKITFNYEWINYPKNFSYYGPSITITKIRCFIENNTIKVEFSYIGGATTGYLNFHVNLYTETKQLISSYQCDTWIKEANESGIKTTTIAEKPYFLRLEPGEYYVNLSSNKLTPKTSNE